MTTPPPFVPVKPVILVTDAAIEPGAVATRVARPSLAPVTRAEKRGRVVGFLFSNDHHVVLVLKDHPPAQAGKLNAPGGKVDPGEAVHDAMKREFREETGLEVSTWRYLGALQFRSDWVYIYTQTLDQPALAVNLSTSEKEPSGWYHVNSVSDVACQMSVVENLKWMMLLALDSGNPVARVVYAPEL